MAETDLIRNEKRRIRERILSQLKNQSPQDRITKGERIREKVLRDPDFQAAQNVMFYSADSYEVPTKDLMAEALKMGKKVSLPRVDPQTRLIAPFQIFDLQKDLEKGTYGILEPKAIEERRVSVSAIELVFAPGVAFDDKGHRMGRGLGYYDRFLKELCKETLKVGLAFDFQSLDRVPTLPHDVCLDRIITND